MERKPRSPAGEQMSQEYGPPTGASDAARGAARDGNEESAKQPTK
jgi:hypothetical protein